MPDCASCNRPLGAQLRRCAVCGACERCCDKSHEQTFMDPLELGLVELDTAIVRRRVTNIGGE